MGQPLLGVSQHLVGAFFIKKHILDSPAWKLFRQGRGGPPHGHGEGDCVSRREGIKQQSPGSIKPRASLKPIFPFRIVVPPLIYQ
jgi:hypothetical protein